MPPELSLELSDQTPTLEDLSRPEHLLILALRAIAVGHGDCPLVAQTFSKACGPLGSQALGAYFALVRYIGVMGRRRLRVHVPGCPCVSVDETAIIGLVAAAQRSDDEVGDSLFKMRMRFLVEGEPNAVFLSAARAVARVFEASGHTLPLRLDGDGPAPARTGSETLRLVH
jgi:hypothetical protein